MKSNITYSLFLTLLSAIVFAQKGEKPLWIADNGDGTYTNPIVFADYSDPDVIRVGEDFYMTASSFNSSPGLPILHSKDLVNWEIVNYALKKQLPEDIFAKPQHSKGVWAPSIRFHNQEYYIYWGDPDYGVYMIKAKDPKGTWSAPLLVLPGKGIIDPCPLWDGENTYLIHAWAGSRAGINSILTIHTMNPEGTQVLDDGKNVFDGHGENHTIEGPKLYKKDDYYYILAPAGGVETGWQLALRSKNIYGPYEVKRVLEQGSTAFNGPHQGAWITAPDNTSWFLHFQDQGVYGRILLLEPVQWKNGWPIMGQDFDSNGVGEPVTSFKKPVSGQPVKSSPTSDDFTNGVPGLQWQWYANQSVTWSAQIPGTDYLRLFAINKKEEPNLWDVPNILLQKLPAPNFTATTKVTLTTEWDTRGKTAGLIMMGRSYAYVGIAYHHDKYWVQQILCEDAIDGHKEKIIEEKELKNSTVYLQMKVTAPDATCSFEYSENGKKYISIGTNFKAQRDVWISAKMGLFSVSDPDVRMGGYADFDWFKVSNL